MKKRRTPKTNTIKATATKAVEAVKETAEKVTDKIAEEAPMLAENITAKTEEIMNSPIVEEGKEILKETKEKASQAIRSKISEVNVEIFETNVSLEAIENAVKKAVSDKKLKGDIKVYINAEQRAAYYTVNGEGAEDYKIDLRTL
ncbi:MAG: DUF6465 family protein [Oliverpabstia sp.]